MELWKHKLIGARRARRMSAEMPSSGAVRELPDHRCLSMPDVPYSSYCKVCWHPIYTLWISKADHKGACMHGHVDARDCREACNRDRNSIEMQRLRAAIAQR